MKNFKTFLMVFLIVSGIVFLSSCSKDSELPIMADIQLEDGVSVQDGILNFETIDAYTKTIDALSAFDEIGLNRWEKAINFSSLRSNSVVKNSTKLVKEVGPTFSTLLNQNKEIIIDGYYFKLNFEKEKVIARKIDVENCDLTSSFANEERVFSFEDDALKLLSINDDDNFKSIMSGCNSNSYGIIIMNQLDNGHAQYGIRYSKFGVYCILVAEIEPTDGINIEVWIFTSGNCTWRKCGSSVTNTVGAFTGHKIDDYLQHTIWEGYFASLCDYDAYVTFGAKSSSSDYYTESASLSCN
jgi:hypothetical protein